MSNAYQNFIQNNNTGQYHASLTNQANGPKGKAEMGKNDFLNLLVTQLSHQDPLNPMEDKDFTAQMAQFSSLEQLTNISKGIETLTQGTQRQEMLSAVSFIDKEVMAEGDTISMKNGKVSKMSFTIGDPASNVHINIFDSNGNIVNTIEMKALQAGTYDVNWDGKDFNGKSVPEGVYSASLAAENGEGKPIMASTTVSGVVKGVRVEGSTYYLTLEDGREVNLMNITKVVGAATANKGTGGKPDPAT